MFELVNQKSLGIRIPVHQNHRYYLGQFSREGSALDSLLHFRVFEYWTSNSRPKSQLLGFCCPWKHWVSLMISHGWLTEELRLH